MKNFASLTLFCLAFLFSAFAPAVEKVNVELNLSEGESFKHWVLNEQTIHQTIQGRDQEINQKTGIGYAQTVKAVLANGYKLEVKYYRILFSIDMKGMQNFSYDSKEGSKKVPGPAMGMAALVGKSFEIEVDKKGNVQSITGFSEMIESVVDEVSPGADDKRRASLIDGMEKTISQASIQTHMGMILSVMPQNSTETGDQWTEKVELTEMVPMNAILDFTVEGMDASELQLSVEGEVETKMGEIMEEGGMEMEVDLGGGLEGDLILDTKKGYVISGTTNSSITGQVSASGNMTLPMMVDTQTTVKLDK